MTHFCVCGLPAFYEIAQFRPDWKKLPPLPERLPPLSASWGPPWNSSKHYRTMVLRGLREALNWSPIMPDSSISESKCNFFQSSWNQKIVRQKKNQKENILKIEFFSKGIGT